MGHEVVAEVVELGPGGRGLRRRPAGGAQPVAVVRAPRHRARCARRARPATSASAGASPPATSAPGIHTGVSSDATGGYAELMPAHSSMLFAVPDAIDDEHAIFADPFAVSLHSVTRHPPPARRPGRSCGAPARSARARSPSCGPSTPTCEVGGRRPLRRAGRAGRRRSAPTRCSGSAPPAELVEQLAAWSGGVLRPTMEGLRRRPDVPSGRHRRRLRHGRQARDASRSRCGC